MSERELLWECIAFLERTSYEAEGDRSRLADKLRAALADRSAEEPEVDPWYGTGTLPMQRDRPEQPAIQGDGKDYARYMEWKSKNARPEPAQPVAQDEYVRNVLTGIADWFESRSVTAWAKRYWYSDLMRRWAHDLRSMLIAAPPSHPAPSLAANPQQITESALPPRCELCGGAHYIGNPCAGPQQIASETKLSGTAPALGEGER